MQNSVRQQLTTHNWLPWLIVPGIIALAALLGLRASTRWLTLLLAGIGAVLLLWRPALGLTAIIAAALLVRREFDTGSAVKLNTATLLVMAMLGIWLLQMVRAGKVTLARSRTTLPLLLFVGFGLLSLLIGNATWDPNIARSANFTIVQLAQWAIFALAAGAFLLTANLIHTEAGLRTLTWSFLWLAGTIAILGSLPVTRDLARPVTTLVFIRAPFWVLLFSLAAGLLMFDRSMRTGQRLFLAATAGAVLYQAFGPQFGSSSTWVSVAAAAAVLVWLRWPKLRWPVAIAIGLLALSNLLFPALYDFAGGDDEWFRTGGPRVALIQRVLAVVQRNPITGLGPASYRLYANAQPLRYEHITWFNPRVSSHNNYIDLFAHVGIIGIALFVWFVFAAGRLGLGLLQRYQEGFRSAYANALLAAGIASLLLMTFADWILPFVYNIGFPGFQASILVWLFLGGLVALDNLPLDGAEG
jgi:hypothetical protein